MYYSILITDINYIEPIYSILLLNFEHRSTVPLFSKNGVHLGKFILPTLLSREGKDLPVSYQETSVVLLLNQQMYLDIFLHLMTKTRELKLNLMVFYTTVSLNLYTIPRNRTFDLQIAICSFRITRTKYDDIYSYICNNETQKINTFLFTTAVHQPFRSKI